MTKNRQLRKVDHLKLAGLLPDGPEKAGFQDVALLHRALPELNWEEIDITSEILGRKVAFPLLINAITGGARETRAINKALARVAKECGLAMAVGSQRAALEDPDLRETFQVVREVNPEGVIFANLSCHATLEEAREAVAMVKADALQVHLNVPQELAMAEGDRKFRGCLENIALLARELEVPVIVKEVGFGICGEVARLLLSRGIKHIDIGGQGGTNFIAIEKIRQGEDVRQLEPWGISTACSLVEVAAQGVPGLLVASGGIRTPLDMAKALALGAQAAAIAGPFVKLLQNCTLNQVIARVETFKGDFRKILLMVGARNIRQLTRVPAIITGPTREWLCERGYDTRIFARRQDQ